MEKNVQISKNQNNSVEKHPLIALDMLKVKADYGDRFKELRSIINEYDPIGLIDIGAPSDEYDPEVKTIIVQLKNEMTKQEVHELVYQEFQRWFGMGEREDYEELAAAIFEWLKK
jgi:hypothetical protein